MCVRVPQLEYRNMATNGMEELNEQENIPAQAPPPPVPMLLQNRKKRLMQEKRLLAKAIKKENRRVRRLKKNLHRLSEGDIHELLLMKQNKNVGT